MSPHCDPKHEDSKPILLHDTSAHNVASPYQVWLQKISGWGDIVQMNIHWNSEPICAFIGILNLFCDLDLDHNRAIQSFHKTIHLMMMCHQTKFSCKRISSSDNILKRHSLIMLSVIVTMTLKSADPSFWGTIRLTMMHYHTRFGSKRFIISEDIIQTTIHWPSKILLWPRPWTHQSNVSMKRFCFDNVLSNHVR